MLKRDITTTSGLIAAAGGMVGSAWLFAPFIGAQTAGSNILIAWIIAAVFMLFIALPLCELGALFPVSGGIANYPSMTHGETVGFLFGLTTWLSYVVMTPIEVQAILQYSGRFFPALVAHDPAAFRLSGLGYGVAIIIIFAVAVLNSFGIKLLAESNKYVSLLKFALPTLAIIAFISVGSTSNIDLHLSNKRDWQQIWSALSTAGVIFAFTGFQNGLMLGGEIQRPERNIPLAILGAVGIGFILYFFLQLGFIMGVPQADLAQGWGGLRFPHLSAPLVGLLLLLGFNVIASLLMFDAVLSPFGTTLVYTAATSRILYGLSQNGHLPKLFLKLNRYKIPYRTLIANCAVGMLAFLPFPGWQKMVTFLSSTSLLSYVVGPICLLSIRRLDPKLIRPFKVLVPRLISYIAFYICNLMLYWCSFSILWKLNVVLLIGLLIHFFCQNKSWRNYTTYNLYWFISYMVGLLILSYLGGFGGRNWIEAPWDLILIFVFSCVFLRLSTNRLTHADYETFQVSSN